jgi:CBS domain containing-hemolysin-like protein
MIFLEVLVLLGLFACAAFFALSEAAVTALSALRMKRLSLFQPGLSGYFNEWLSKPHRLLTTLMVASNVISVAISSLAAAMAVPLIGRVPEKVLGVSVWLLTTVTLLIFGEMIPKIIGRVYRERVSVLVLPFLSRLTRLLFVVWSPAVWMLKKLAPGLATPPVNRLTALSLEELHHMIGESQAEGQMPSEDGEMMKRVLSLPQRAVSDIMQPANRVDAIHLEILGSIESAEQLFVDLLVETGHTRVPVMRGGDPVGYVNVMDLLKEWRSGRVASLEELVRPIRRVPASMKVFALLQDFQKSGEHLAIVEQEGRKKFLGLVTLEDVLEEIVGEILDEYDLEQKKE